MKATEANLLKFIRKSPQFVIPIYQRNYSWTEAQCKQLWIDLMRAGRDDKIKAHFIGSIVYVERALGSVTSQESLLVIDGQQRLTTCTLLIAALAKHFQDNQLAELLDAFSARKLRNYYLLNPDENGERHYKLILSETDKQTLLTLINQAPTPAESSTRVLENYQLFMTLISEPHNELECICKGLSKLVIVEVALDRAHDNPQLIFESMNSTGLELSQADLIRNFILMGLEPQLQTQLYTQYWRPIEKGFGQAAYANHFDAFMRHYLITKTGDIPNVREVYSAFKQYARNLNTDVSALVADIHAYATYYCAMALGAEKHPGLNQAFHDLRELKVDVAYPFLLELYHDYQKQHLTVEETLQVVRLVESFVFRRAICGIPTNSLNKTFASFTRSLKKDRYVESVRAAFLLLPSYRRFPSDDEFQREFKQRDLYHFPRRSYWLRKLENHGRKERVTVEDYTIEHIMPQNASLSLDWLTDLGPEWERIHQTWLHTLGNLTLTGYNSEYSDAAFTTKRDLKDKQGNPVGFASSPLRLNLGLGKVQRWDEAAIKERSNRLAQEGVTVWGMPQLDAEALNAYRPRPIGIGHGYSITDHLHLAGGAMRDLFDALRQSVIALDPCVSEEFLKLYVAYKAETNFVDVVPQARRLRLSLNMPFHEIDDPKGLCKDVSGLGRWGNGDVEIGLSSPGDLSYVLGLIRQSFDRQMGGGSE